MIFITQCHVDRNWPAQARVRLYHSCTAMSLVRLQPTCALIQKKNLGMGGGSDEYLCLSERGGGPRHILSNFTKKIKKKNDFSKVPRPPLPPPHLLSSRSTHGIHSCLIFKENIVYYIYVVFNISMIKNQILIITIY